MPTSRRRDSFRLGRGTKSFLWPAAITTKMNVKPAEVIEMDTCLSGLDLALYGDRDDDDEAFAAIAYLADEASEFAAFIGQ